MKVLLGLAVLMWVCWGQQQTSGPPELARVNITVSDTFGKSLSKPMVSLKEIGSKVDHMKLAGDGGVRFDGISFGLYNLEVQVAGFTTWRERVGIYQPKVNLAVGLFVAPIDEAERSEIAGSITMQKRKPGDLWVRLVPRYSSDFLEDRVTAGGTFHLGNLHPGRFVLLVFDNENLIVTKTIDYHGGKMTLSLDVPDRN